MTAIAERAYIRHPTDVSIDVSAYSRKEQLNLQLNNVSVGGLSFTSDQKFHKDTVVKLKISEVKPVFKVNAIVRWCREQSHDQEKIEHKEQQRYELGVEFLDTDDAFKVRMVEQVCHIGEYRKKLQKKEGKRVSWNRASEEWIQKNASSFPN